MNASEVKLCERCWYPIATGSRHAVRLVRDTAHPLLATLSSFTHLDGDPTCHGASTAEGDLKLCRVTGVSIAAETEDGRPPDARSR